MALLARLQVPGELLDLVDVPLVRICLGRPDDVDAVVTLRRPDPDGAAIKVVDEVREQSLDLVAAEDGPLHTRHVAHSRR